MQVKAKRAQKPNHKARESLDKKTIKMLIDIGATDIESKDKSGHTPLNRACYYGYTEIVTSLLEAGANINVKTEYGSTCLAVACEMGNHDIIRLLLKAGANINEGNPLVSACEMGQMDIAEMLILKGAFVDMKDSSVQKMLKKFAHNKGLTNAKDYPASLLKTTNTNIDLPKKPKNT